MSTLSSPAALRHDLRSEINQLLGYTELLLEETDLEPDGRLNARLDRIRQVARQTLVVLNRHLEPEELSANLTTPLSLVRDHTARLRLELAAQNFEALAGDVDRIESAARRALILVRRAAGTKPAAEATPVPGPTPLFTMKTDGETVLVVDDDEANRELLARRIEHLGFQALRAANGRQALATLQTVPVDLMLLDVMMPGLDGYEVLAQKQADAAIRDIPTVMISALDETAGIARCIEMGADDYLPKPFDPVLLQARVGSCLERKRLQDQERQLLASVQAQVAEQVEELEHLGRLRRFLSPQVAELVLSAGDVSALNSHRRDVAILFCDLRHFTAFAEASSPEVVMAVLQQYHTEVAALIHRFEATVGYFAGDGIMVFFNDPLPCEEPARRAVELAVAIREGTRELTREWAQGGHGLDLGVGIAFGEATLGEIGFEGRFDYAVIGRPVNLAARLSDRAEPRQILISPEVREATLGVFETEDIGPLDLKGFSAPVPGCNVVGLREQG